MAVAHFGLRRMLRVEVHDYFSEVPLLRGVGKLDKVLRDEPSPRRRGLPTEKGCRKRRKIQ